MENLRSAHNLKNEEEVMDQMRMLHTMESTLETEHASFVRLSQLCSELVSYFIKLYVIFKFKLKIPFL